MIRGTRDFDAPPPLLKGLPVLTSFAYAKCLPVGLDQAREEMIDGAHAPAMPRSESFPREDAESSAIGGEEGRIDLSVLLMVEECSVEVYVERKVVAATLNLDHASRAEGVAYAELIPDVWIVDR